MLAAGAVGLASCLVAEPALSPEGARDPVRVEREAERPHPVVVLVAIDGVRWQEVFNGVDAALARRFRLRPSEVVSPESLMPNLHRLMREEGAAIGAPGTGAEIVASGPNWVSLPGYLEILRGRRHSRCTENTCPPTADRTLADEFAAFSEGWATEVAVIASWPGILRAAARYPERLVVSAGRRGGPTRHYLTEDAESASWLARGASAPAYPGHGDYRPDRFTAPLALRYLETQSPRFLFVGLGDTDAFAHRGLYRDYLAALRFADQTVGEIARCLAALRAQGYATTLFVTTDHGRGPRFAGHGAVAPESARVWLVASGSSVRARGLIASPQLRRLADIAPTVRHVAGLRAEPSVDAGRVLDELALARR